VRERLSIKTPNQFTILRTYDGTRRAGSTPYGATDVAFMERLAGLLVDHDDALLAAYVDDERTIAYSQLCEKLAAQTKQALVHPVWRTSSGGSIAPPCQV
jgi:hypothetical protein